MADSFCLCLERAGHQVIVEYSGQDAMLALDEHEIDLIILDMFLSEGNGLQFLQELRSYGDTMNMPVIVCSTAAKQIPMEVARQFGILTVLDKTTLTPAVLRTAVEAVVVAHE